MLKYKQAQGQSIWRQHLNHVLHNNVDLETVLGLFANQLQQDAVAEKVTDCALNTPRLNSALDKQTAFAHKLAFHLFLIGEPVTDTNFEVLKKYTYIRYQKLLSTLSRRFKDQIEAAELENRAAKDIRYAAHRKNFCTLKARPPSDLILNPTPMPVTVPPREELQPFFDYLQSNTSVPRSDNGEVNYIELKRGIHYDDGRMDLCKQVVGPPHIGALMESIRQNPFVEHFLLGNNIIGLEGAKQIASFIQTPHAGKIQTWYLAGNEINADGIKLIASALSTDTHANALWLKRNPIKPEGAQHLAEMLKINTSIKILDLDNTGILDTGAVAIFEALKTNRRMRHLYMSANALTPITATAIADYFNYLVANNLRGLKTLWLSINRLDDEGIIMIAESLRHYKWLKTLDLGANRMSAVSCKVVCEAFHNSPLTCLNLGLYKSTGDLGELPNNIGDAGAEYVAGLIETNTHLRILDVSHNGMTPTGVARLATAMQKNQNLYFLGYHQLGSDVPSTLVTGIQQKLRQNVWDSLGITYDEFHSHHLRYLKHFPKVKNIDSNYRNSMK